MMSCVIFGTVPLMTVILSSFGFGIVGMSKLVFVSVN